MKKILFVNNNMKIGGVQRALLNMLKAIQDDYDITLLLFAKTGELLEELPPGIRVIEGGKMLSLLGLSRGEAREKGLFWFLMRSLLVGLTKVVGNRLPIWLVRKCAKKQSGYDVAVSYFQNSRPRVFYGGTNDYVLFNTKATEKIAVVHCDFARYGGATPHHCKLYRKFDKVLFVSRSCVDSFLKVVPTFPQEKIQVVPNFHDFKAIQALAEADPICYDPQYYNVVTVARISGEKGLLRAFQAVADLCRYGYQLRWHIVGDGAQRAKLEGAIRQAGMGDSVFLYGESANPYAYIKNANLFLLPSYHEAAPLVFGEAHYLGVPILSTNTLSAKELVQETGAGVVCDDVFRGLQSILEAPQKMKPAATKPNNDVAYQQIKRILG